MRRWIGLGLFGLGLAAGIAAAGTPAPPPRSGTTTQAGTSSATTTTTATAGAYDRLSPGNQKIAQALFSAQTTTGGTGSPTPLSLNQIAGMKQRGQGWGEIFQAMKAQGLLQQKNLGQVVSRYSRQHRSLATTPRTPTTSSRAQAPPVKLQGNSTHGEAGRDAGDTPGRGDVAAGGLSHSFGGSEGAAAGVTAGHAGGGAAVTGGGSGHMGGIGGGRGR